MQKRSWAAVVATAAFVAAIGACQETPTEPDDASFAKPGTVIDNSNGALDKVSRKVKAKAPSKVAALVIPSVNRNRQRMTAAPATAPASRL